MAFYTVYYTEVTPADRWNDETTNTVVAHGGYDYEKAVSVKKTLESKGVKDVAIVARADI